MHNVEKLPNISLKSFSVHSTLRKIKNCQYINYNIWSCQSMCWHCKIFEVCLLCIKGLTFSVPTTQNGQTHLALKGLRHSKLPEKFWTQAFLQ